MARGQSQSYTLTSNAPKIAQQLSFVARCVQVDNYTSAFVRIPGATRDVPPYLYGTIVPIDGTQIAEASLVATVPPYAAGPPVPSNVASLTFYEADLTPDAGHLLSSAVYNLPQVLGSVTAPANTTVPKSFPLPSGTVSVGYGINFAGGGLGTPVEVVINGDQTQTVYRDDLQPGIPPVHASLVDSVDTSITVAVTASIPIAAKVDVLAWIMPVTMTVAPDISVPFPVTFHNNLSGQSALPAPWQAANLEPFTIAAVIAAGGNTNIIPAVAGMAIYLFSLSMTVDALGAAGSDIRFFDGVPGGGGAERGRIGYNVQPPPIQFNGTRLTVGNGWYFFNGGAGAVTIRGTVTASQGP